MLAKSPLAGLTRTFIKVHCLVNTRKEAAPLPAQQRFVHHPNPAGDVMHSTKKLPLSSLRAFAQIVGLIAWRRGAECGLIDMVD